VKEKKTGLPLLLMAVFAVTRWPGCMPENFSAAYALAFCAGVYFPGAMAWWAPLGTLVATDILLNCFCYNAAMPDSNSTLQMLFYLTPNYAAYGASIWLGRRFGAAASWLKLLAGGVMGALLFYFLTNTWAWVQNPEYAKTVAGWIQALTVGTPGWPHTWEFFRNTLLSGGLFTGLFAGAMKLAPAPDPEEASAEDEQPAADPVEAETEESKA
jgi:hypothetical protein